LCSYFELVAKTNHKMPSCRGHTTMDSIPTNQIVVHQEETTMEANDDIKETNELLSTTNLSSPSDLNAWKRRITTDGTAIWEAEEVLQHFPLPIVRKIRMRWGRFTVNWLKLELQKQQEGDRPLSDAMLEKVYQLPCILSPAGAGYANERARKGSE
jgi:hypothetical protein